VTAPSGPGTGLKTVRLALYLYYPDGSSAVATGEDLLVITEFDYGGHMTDIQAAPELVMRSSAVMSLRIYPASGRNTLLVTKRPPITPV
jgi:hypothetical protein